jgi:hypothetical protein
MSLFDNMFKATPPSVMTTDPRNPTQQAVDAQRAAAASNLMGQYNGGNVASAYATPGYGLPPSFMASLMADYAGKRGSGLPSAKQQLDQQQTIMDSALSRASAQGAQGSGYANQQMARGVVDYQTGLAKTLTDFRVNMASRIIDAMRASEESRRGLAQSSAIPLQAGVSLYGQNSSPYVVTPVQGKNDMFSSIFGSMLGGGAGGGGGMSGIMGLLSKMFGGGNTSTAGGMDVGSIMGGAGASAGGDFPIAAGGYT